MSMGAPMLAEGANSKRIGEEHRLAPHRARAGRRHAVKGGRAEFTGVPSIKRPSGGCNESMIAGSVFSWKEGLEYTKSAL